MLTGRVIAKGKAGTSSYRNGGKTFGEVPSKVRRTGVSELALDALKDLRGAHIECEVYCP